MVRWACLKRINSRTGPARWPARSRRPMPSPSSAAASRSRRSRQAATRKKSVISAPAEELRSNSYPARACRAWKSCESKLAQEVEIKFPLRDRADLTNRLRDLGGQRLYPETFEDNVVLDRRGELRTRGALLRVRKFGKYSLATYKGPMSIEDGIKSREEVQTGVESFELAIQLFDSLGFKPVFRYQKYREVWRVREVEVVIDRTPIGDYFEIEGNVEPIRAVDGELGVNVDQAVLHS